VAPDCFVVWGVAPQRRLIYKLWEEGKAPGVVFEVTSKSTKREDWVTKMALYARLGVQEYYLYDPTGDYLRPTLQAFQLQGKDYLPMSPANQDVQLGELSLAPAADEPPEYVSPLLGLRLAVSDTGWLEFYDEATGQRLLNDEEARLRAEEENARLREELARLRDEM
jgi:hypothetical protein